MLNSETLNALSAILVEKNIYNSTLYKKFREDNHYNYNGCPLPGTPWSLAKLSVRQFFDLIFPSRPKIRFNKYYNKITRRTMEEHIQLAREHKVFRSQAFTELVKSMATKEYYATPWYKFKIDIDQFFRLAHPDFSELVFESKIKKTTIEPLDHVRLCIENNLTNSKKWRNFYLSKREEFDILSRPWDRFRMTENEFFSTIRNKNMEAFEFHNECA